MSWGETGFLAGKIDGQFDISKYEPFQYRGSAPPSLFTVVDIVGKGFLKCALAAFESTITENAFLKITIDGQVVFHSIFSSTSGSRNIGVILEELMMVVYTGTVINIVLPVRGGTSGTSFSTAAPSDLSAVFPYTLGASKVLTPIALPIFFNQSLKIEVDSKGSNSMDYYVSGGIQV